MPRVMHKTALALIAALLASPAWSDTLIGNVNGMQVGADGKLERFENLLIGSDGHVVAVIGPDADYVPPRGTKVIDAHGKTLLPGLIDAHGHVLDLGMTQMTVQLVGTSSIADLQTRLRDYAAAHPRDAWIIGFGWNQELWPDKRYPTADELLYELEHYIYHRGYGPTNETLGKLTEGPVVTGFSGCRP